MFGPGELGGGGRGLDDVAGGQVVGDLVDLLLAVVEIDGVLTVGCGDEFWRVGIEWESGEYEALAGDSGELAVEVKEGGEWDGGVVERLEMVEVGGDAGGEEGGEGEFELLLDLCGVCKEAALTPVEGDGAGEDDFEGAGDVAGGVDGEVGGVRGDGVAGGYGGAVAVVGDAERSGAEAAGEGVLPGELAEGAELFAGVGEDVFAVQFDADEEGVELVHAEGAGIKEAVAAVGDLHGAGVEAGGAEEGEVEGGDFVGRAGAGGPDIGSCAVFTNEVEGAALGGVLLGDVVGVVDGLDGVVELAGFGFVGVSTGGELGGGGAEGVGDGGEAVEAMEPALAFVVPVDLLAGIGGVIKGDVVGEFAHGWGVGFLDVCGDIAKVEEVVALGADVDLCGLGQAGGKEDGSGEFAVDVVGDGGLAAEVVGGAERAEGLEVEVFVVGGNGALDLPVGDGAGECGGGEGFHVAFKSGDDTFAGDWDGPLVLEDGADGYVGEIEDGDVAAAADGFELEQVGGFAGEGDDGAVGMDGAAFDDGWRLARGSWDLDGGVFLAGFGEDLDAGVLGDVVGAVVGGFLQVEVDGGSAGSGGVRGHLKIGAGGFLELLGVEDRGEGEHGEEGGAGEQMPGYHVVPFAALKATERTPEAFRRRGMNAEFGTHDSRSVERRKVTHGRYLRAKGKVRE